MEKETETPKPKPSQTPIFTEFSKIDQDIFS
jgi:hypothetical protein